MLEYLNEEELQAIQSVARVFIAQSEALSPFRPKTEKEMIASVDRGIAQADRGEGQDALEALEEIVAVLEGDSES